MVYRGLGHQLSVTLCSKRSEIACRKYGADPTIGPLKSHGRRAQCPLKGSLGDALHTVLRGAGRNILANLREL